MIEQRYYNVRQASAYLGIKEFELRRYANKGMIPFSRPGGKLIMFDKQDLDQFINKGRQNEVPLDK